ncbi:hypothetical protein DPMN_104619 [Dreissena polymorpha]|uniref:Uncharacterized protein n=1 Tax=Dreissena polymorpha TaxID=45954 RepID=A0A9D4HAB8_DREPO|nr:hypothetical protein DPMN_104619 [Dreissena polymorpha]
MNYTDFHGNYHSSQLCQHYCCWSLSLTDMKICCNEIWRLNINRDENYFNKCMNVWLVERGWILNIGISIIVFMLARAYIRYCFRFRR